MYDVARCVSISSIGDSSSDCVIRHGKQTGSYVGWVSEDQKSFYWAIQQDDNARLGTGVCRHSFERANSFPIAFETAQGESEVCVDTDDAMSSAANLHVYIIRNFNDCLLLFVRLDTHFLVTDLQGNRIIEGTTLQSWGTLPDLLWLYCGAEKTLTLKAVSDERCVHLALDEPPPSNFRVFWNPAEIILLHALNDTGASGRHLRTYTVQRVRLNHTGGDMSEVHTIDWITHLTVLELSVVSDELPYSLCPLDSEYFFLEGSVRHCAMQIVEANGIIPLGFLARQENQNLLNATTVVNIGRPPQHAECEVHRKTNGDMHEDSDGSTNTWLDDEMYRLARMTVSPSLTWEEIAIEKSILFPADPTKSVMHEEWYARIQNFGSSRSIARFFHRLKTIVELSKQHQADIGYMESILRNLYPLLHRKIPPPIPIVQTAFSFKLYDTLASTQAAAVYAYVMGRYDVLLGDGHWQLSISKNMNFTNVTRYSMSATTLWDPLIKASTTQNWNLVIKNVNAFITERIYRQYKIGYGQNLFGTQVLQIPWTKLSDIGGFGFPWGRHGPLNRVDLWLDLIVAYLNSLTQIAPDRITSLFRLRVYPEIGNLTKLFSYSPNTASEEYAATINRAFNEENSAVRSRDAAISDNSPDSNSSPAREIPILTNIPDNTTAPTFAPVGSSVQAPVLGDVMAGTLWCALRECYFVSGMLLGYGVSRSKDNLVEAFPTVEMLLEKLHRHSSKRFHSFLSNSTITDNGMLTLDHALDHSDEPDWYHDNLESKKSPAVNLLLITLILSCAIAGNLNCSEIMSILYAPCPLTDDKHQCKNYSKSFLLKMHKRYNLKAFDGYLYLASGLCPDRNITESVLFAHRLLYDLEYLKQQPHTNIDSLTSDAYDLKIEGLQWYKRLHTDKMKATHRQGLLLGAALGTHLGHLCAMGSNIHAFKTQCLLSIMKLYEPGTVDAKKILEAPGNTLTAGSQTNLTLLLEAGLTLAIGVGYRDWACSYQDAVKPMVPVLFDSHFFLRSVETIFYRTLAWCLLHWSKLNLADLNEFIPVALATDPLDLANGCKSPLSSLITFGTEENDQQKEDIDETNVMQFDDNLVRRPPIASPNILVAAETALSQIDVSQRLDAHLAVITAICFALALKHTACDVTSVTEFILQTGSWLVNHVPRVNDSCFVLSQFTESHIVGITDSTRTFALNWIIAALGFSCAGSHDQIVVGTIEQWKALSPDFSILFRASSACSLIQGQAFLREATKFVQNQSSRIVDPRIDSARLSLDVLSAMPMGRHWGDNRECPQIFDLFSQIWSSDVSATPILNILGCRQGDLQLSHHIGDEQDVYVVDSEENMQNLSCIQQAAQKVVHYPENFNPVELRNRKSTTLFLQRTQNV